MRAYNADFDDYEGQQYDDDPYFEDGREDDRGGDEDDYDYIAGLDDDFQDDVEYDDDYESRSGSDVEDWGFDIVQEEDGSQYGDMQDDQVPGKDQSYGRTGFAAASNASTTASGPKPMAYPPLPTGNVGAYEDIDKPYAPQDRGTAGAIADLAYDSLNSISQAFQPRPAEVEPAPMEADFTPAGSGGSRRPSKGSRSASKDAGAPQSTLTSNSGLQQDPARRSQRPIRDSEVTDAVRFLSHPTIMKRGDDAKRDALKRQGLSDDEVEVAMAEHLKGIADDSKRSSRPRPPPLDTVTEAKEPRNSRSSIRKLFNLRSSTTSSESKTSPESPPESPRSPRGSEKRSSKKHRHSSPDRRSDREGQWPSSPHSEFSSEGRLSRTQSPDRVSNFSKDSPRASVTSPNRGSKRRSSGKRRSSSPNRDGRNSRNSKTREKRSFKERICGCPTGYARNVPARYPCTCCLFSYLIVFGIIGAGIFLNIPTVDTDLDSLMKTVVNSSVTYDAFLAAADQIKDKYAGRRLQATIAAYFHSDLYFAYELSEGSPYESITDFEALLKIFQFEQGLRSLSAWQDECFKADFELRQFCDPGISLANYMLPSHQVPADSVLPSELTLDGKGQDVLPPLAAFHLVDLHQVHDVLFPRDFVITKPNVQSPPSFRTAYFFKVAVGSSLDSQQVLKGSVNKVRERWEEFIKNTVLPYVTDAKEEMQGINVYYTGAKLQGMEVMSTLMADLNWAIGSFCFVLVYLIWHTRSLFSSVFGLLTIITSIPLALVTFMFISSSSTVNIASFLAVFLVVGLGADVVFVYTDFFRDSSHVYKDMGHRVVWTYKHAGKASLATTVTTALSFFANVASVLRSLRDFGMFMGLCVVYVWVLVSLIYVPICVFEDRHNRGIVKKACSRTCRYCCCNRSRIFACWVRRVYRWKLSIFILAVLLGLTAVILPMMQVEADMATPNIFPSDHNQNRGARVIATFPTYESLSWVEEVDKPPPPLNAEICSDWTFADLLPCTMFWCEAEFGAKKAADDSCTCYHKFQDCPASGIQKSVTRIVGANQAWSSAKVATFAEEYMTNATNSGLLSFNAQVRAAPPMVIERWETGDSIINNVVEVESDTQRNGQLNPSGSCGWHAVCFCGQSRCKKGPDWDITSDIRLSSRRLEADSQAVMAQFSPILHRNLAGMPVVPPGQRELVEVAFGILVNPGVPIFGEKPPEELWSFLDSFQPAQPRAQRDMYTLCSKASLLPQLRVLDDTSMCWIKDFRSWLLKRGKRFPSPADIFFQDLTQFLRTGTTGGRFSREFLWRQDGQVKAAYVGFSVNIRKTVGSREALDFKAHWDKFMTSWNEEASPFARGAFHTSKLWVQADAQQELMSSTVTTLLVLGVLSFFSMLLFTRDVVLSAYVVASTIWVVVGLFFFIVIVCQWQIGPIEAIALIVFIGYALTYSLHVAHVYCDKEAVPEPSPQQRNMSMATADGMFPTTSESNTVRLQRTGFAVRSIGGAVLGSAFTTIGCTVFLLLCTLTIFLKLGAVVLVVTFLSVCASFIVMPATLLLMGPVHPGVLQTPELFRALLARLRLYCQTLFRRKTRLSISADRASTSLAAVAVHPESFAEGVMDDEPASLPPTSTEPTLPGVGGIVGDTTPSKGPKKDDADMSIADEDLNPIHIVGPQPSPTQALYVPSPSRPSDSRISTGSIPAYPMLASDGHIAGLDDDSDDNVMADPASIRL